MKLISDYKNDHKLRASFNHLTQEVFGIDFESWYQRGFWDDTYVCHSFYEEGQIVSNVSVTKLKLFSNGNLFHAIQIGTVMTKKEYHGNALAVKLTNIVIDKYRRDFDFFYLFARKINWEYYTKQEFIPADEYHYSLNINKAYTSYKTLRKLNLFNNEDLYIIQRLTQSRLPVSKIFGVLNVTSIFLFYCLNTFSDNLYYSDADDCLLVFTINKNQVVHLYDVVHANELYFADIMALICSEVTDVNNIMFHYIPTYSDINIKPVAIKSGSKMFVKGDASILPSLFLYPEFADT